MNKVELIGRLTKDPELRYKQDDTHLAVSHYFLAVNRKYQHNENNEADYISCVAFGKAAEFAKKYFKKGTKIAVIGSLRTGSYTNKDGQKVYTTDVFVEEQEFTESKNSGSSATSDVTEDPAVSSESYMDIPDGIEEELPFN